MREIPSTKILMKSNKGFVFIDEQENFEKLLNVGQKVQAKSKDGRTMFTMLVTGVELAFYKKPLDVKPRATCTLVKVKEEKVQV